MKRRMVAVVFLSVVILFSGCAKQFTWDISREKFHEEFYTYQQKVDRVSPTIQTGEKKWSYEYVEGFTRGKDGEVFYVFFLRTSILPLETVEEALNRILHIKLIEEALEEYPIPFQNRRNAVWFDEGARTVSCLMFERKVESDIAR